MNDKKLNCVYIKADLEGAEYESLKSILDSSKAERPLILEVEINIGKRSLNQLGMDLIYMRI